MKKVKQVFRFIYAAILSPFLGVLASCLPRAHRVLVGPLLDGPFRGKLVEQIWDALYALEKKHITNEQFISKVTENMCDAVRNGDIDPWLNRSVGQDENVDLVLCKCLWYLPLKRWYLKLHFMAMGNNHGLHGHRDVLSAQVIARGNLYVQEFDVVGSLNDSPAKLRLRRDGIVAPVDGFVTTNIECNVHGFKPIDGPVVRMQFYLRGQTSIRARLFPSRGRLYVSPNWDTRAGDTVMATVGSSPKQNLDPSQNAYP